MSGISDIKGNHNVHEFAGGSSVPAESAVLISKSLLQQKRNLLKIITGLLCPWEALNHRRQEIYRQMKLRPEEYDKHSIKDSQITRPNAL